MHGEGGGREAAPGHPGHASSPSACPARASARACMPGLWPISSSVLHVVGGLVEQGDQLAEARPRTAAPRTRSWAGAAARARPASRSRGSWRRSSRGPDRRRCRCRRACGRRRGRPCGLARRAAARGRTPGASRPSHAGGGRSCGVCRRSCIPASHEMRPSGAGCWTGSPHAGERGAAVTPEQRLLDAARGAGRPPGRRVAACASAGSSDQQQQRGEGERGQRDGPPGQPDLDAGRGRRGWDRVWRRGRHGRLRGSASAVCVRGPRTYGSRALGPIR